uniref:E4F transcription factor 1 n=1 Tax=Myotis myotis TaxID=51298 RepID=A0A7J7XZH7_MYOMY|nr:E4F transcription factor 1 [Myotis myotis]
MEGAMAVRVTAAHTAEARAEARREAGEGGVEAASSAALAPGGFLGLPAPFSEEDEDDVHRCGRCQAEFTALEDFVQHKLQKVCQRAPPEALPATPAAAALLGQEVVPAVASPEEPITLAHIVVEAAALTPDISHTPDIDSGHIKEVIVAAEVDPGDSEMAEASGSPDPQGPGLAGQGEQAQLKLLVNEDGRYVCALCHKTFKTGSILKAHMVTHSSRKDHECKLCGASFRTKGSLIRHHRRHTDERPYKCAKCGKSFRESGALTRHLKSLTPCTEKIRFTMSKDVVVGKEEAHTGSGASAVGTVTSSSVIGEPMETSPVIHLVTDAKGTVIHEVHVQMQELPLGMKALTPEPPAPKELPCSSEDSRENLLHQAMQNSGIVLERVTGEEGPLEPVPPAASSAQPLGDGPPELPLLEVEQVETQVAHEASAVSRTHLCPQCSETFPTAATLEAHKRSHAGPKLFTCVQCGKAFPKAYLLKKHQEVHVHERRFRCGDCGKLYKTIAHVRGHRRVHSDERPYPCPECGKRYKTKNAQQVHFRTHLEEKPHVCPYCSRGFREKGSLVRHQIVHQASAGHQIIVQNVTMDQEAELGPEAAAADTITIATPESLTEQVAMTLASAISEGTVLTARAGANGTEQATVTMVSSEDIEILEHAGELVIASPEGQLEVQTVIV